MYIGIKKPLPGLKKAINKRVDKMIKFGLENEIKKLIKKHGWTTVLKNAIGYAEFSLSNNENLESVINAIKLHTYQFAKRQITWFKRNKKIHWINNYQQIKNLIKKFLL